MANSRGRTELPGVPACAERSFEMFYERERGGAVRLAYLMTGTFAVAEEVAQEAMLRVQQRWSALHTPEAFLRTVTVNLARSHLRRVRVARRIARPVPAVTRQPELDETWAALRCLNDRQRAAVVLRYYADLPVPDVAAALGVSTTAAQSLLHRALSTLKDKLT